MNLVKKSSIVDRYENLANLAIADSEVILNGDFIQLVLFFLKVGNSESDEFGNAVQTLKEAESAIADSDSTQLCSLEKFVSVADAKSMISNEWGGASAVMVAAHATAYVISVLLAKYANSDDNVILKNLRSLTDFGFYAHRLSKTAEFKSRLFRFCGWHISKKYIFLCESANYIRTFNLLTPLHSFVVCG